MNRRKTFLFIFFIAIAMQTSFSQNWPKCYLTSMGTCPLSATCDYDKGYVIGGQFLTSYGHALRGLLFKTDINGNLLWYKSLGQDDDGSCVYGVNQTNDND